MINHEKRSLRSKVLVSTISQIGSQVYVALLGVIVVKIMTKSLGVENYGIYATILAFVSTFGLLTDIGLNGITTREIARNPSSASEIISYNMGLRIVMCVIVIPLIFGLSYVFYPHGVSTLRVGIIILSLYLFFDAVRTVSLAYFVSKTRNEITAGINAMQQSILLALIIYATLMNYGIYGYIFSFLASCVIVAFIAFVLTKKEIHFRPKFSLEKSSHILKLSFSLGVIQLIGMMYLKADSLLLSIMKGTAEVGIYNIAYSFILAFLTIPGFIMTALAPSITTMDKSAIKPLLEKASQTLLILGCLMASGAFLIKDDLVPIVSDSSFLAAATPFSILALASAFSYLNAVFGYSSVALNKHHRIINISMYCLLLNIILNLVLIPKYSVIGAAWATALSELMALILTKRVFEQQTDIKIGVLKLLYKPLIASALIVILISFSKHIWISNNHVFNFIITSLLLTILYGTFLYLLKGLPEELTDLLKIRRGKVKS